MSLNDISLTAGMRSNLMALQSTTTLLDRTQSRLATGKKVNTALDNPTNFFAAQNHTQRASDLTSRKDGMAEAIQAVKAADKGITGITSLIEAARGLTQSARSGDATGRSSLAAQFNLIRTQIDSLGGDSGYKGKNFLTGDTLNVLFNEQGGSMLTVSGFDARSTALSITSITAGSTATATGTTSFTLSPAIAMHTGVLVTGVATGYATTGLMDIGGDVAGYTVTAAGNLSGVAIDISYTGAFTGSTGLLTGFITVNSITVNGIEYAYTGVMSGNLTSTVGGHINFTVTGVLTGAAILPAGTQASISVNITVLPHASAGTTGVVPLDNTYNLKLGDLWSGLTGLTGLSYNGSGISTGLSGQTVTGIYVVTYASGGAATGLYVNPNQYTLSVNSSGVGQIIFRTGVVPASGMVQYSYNTGYTDSGGLALSTTTFTAQTLTTGQAVTQVYAGSTLLTSAQYSVSGSSITFVTGVGGAIIAISSALTYKVTTTVTGSWAFDSGIDASVNQLDAALTTLRTQAANLASNLNVVSTRQDFTDGMINVLLKGADNLTLADMNEEGANMLMLQTRQQLSTTSLKMASDAAQAVLRLF